jgi:peptidoglycan/LPS O-acetylase OafA/YrhL
MPQLDGLRAFAVMSVLVHHLLEPTLPSMVSSVLGFGLLGVRMFFVLSGFLITGLLIRARDAIDAGSVSSPQAIRLFYVRRTLRIFPLYYLVLALALAFGDAGVRAQLPWLATYTYNFWISWLGWYTSHFSHFWSLCVEEQFYLLWPWIIVYAPRRQWTTIVIVMIVCAPVYRALAMLLGLNEIALYTLTPSSLDALGIGALLATITGGQPATASLERRLRWIALPIGVVGLMLSAFSTMVSATLAEFMVALIFVWLVAGASRGFAGIGRAILEAPVILYLGKISYGIYVYHPLVQDVAGLLLEAGDMQPPPKAAHFLLVSLLTIGVASISWWCFERPINALKNRFREPATRVARASVR